MPDEPKVAPVEEPKVEPKSAEPVEPTVSEALDPSVAPKETEETVPLSALIDLKKANKKLSKDMADLKKSIEDGATPSEVTGDLDALAAEYPDLDPNFLKKFAKTIRAEAKKDADAEVAEKLKPVLEKERAKSFDERFNTHFDKALDAMPEFKDVTNKETIKMLCRAPENKDKTLTQIIEETFGKFVTGKRTIDAGTTRAGKTDSMEIDKARINKDPEYFQQVMADPLLKKKYNEGLTERLSSHL